MKVLILSCNTGEGHNSAGKAVKEAVERAGHEAVMMDMMILAGPRVSAVVGGTYVKIVKYVPRIFQLLYRAGSAITSPRRKSPVYAACSLMDRKLIRFLEEYGFDAVVTPHLFPAETLTSLKHRGKLRQKVVAVATDYTCIPFWEETDCDYYVIPHGDLEEEFAAKGIPREKLLPLGIPVRQNFLRKTERGKAKLRCGLPQEEKTYLVMSGSMGFGKIQLFVMELSRRLRENEGIVVICGNNHHLERLLRKELSGRPNVRILGYTEHVADYMDACDVISTKPGGLTSTEAAAKNIPIIHTRPIPGCEEKNLDFFQSRKMSLAPGRMLAQISAGQKLMLRDGMRRQMEEAQKKNIRPDAADRICRLLETISGETDSLSKEKKEA